VHPAGFKDLPLVGVFATCSPARPNPLLVTVVKVISREDNVLNVFGLEAVDKSPILDIKPYSKHYLSREDVTIAPWMKALEDKFRD
jgi:tRNA (Thr-GGU) A37 N-methylase